MGWWQISDGSETPHYVGDAPWDIVEDAMGQVDQLLAGQPRLSESEAWLLVQGGVPPRLTALKPLADDLAHVVRAMWAELDECYVEAWDRHPLPGEKEALGGKAVGYLMTPTELSASDLAALDASPPEEARSYLLNLREDVRAGGWLRIEDGSRLFDITSVSAFDEWAARRYPNTEAGALAGQGR